MEPATSLVEAYLRINGYFTVTNYPVVLPAAGGGYAEATDVDVLALRFPSAGRMLPGPRGGEAIAPPDPALEAPADRADMILGEVKEGVAGINPATWRFEVLEAALLRFGCCEPGEVERVVESLKRQGVAITAAGHQVRVLVFGTGMAPEADHRVRFVHIDQVLTHLEAYLRTYWTALGRAHFRDDALGFLSLLEKRRRAPR